jgi:tRNA threonylcarbamoyladenosine biosynthesis protein TsaE
MVALVGDLGTGKTTFAQGVGEGLDVSDPIVSPTLILLSEYMDGRLPLLHGDTYRLEAGETEAVGLEEIVEGWSGVVVLEWADRFPDLLPGDRLQVSLKHLGEARAVTVEATGPVHATLLSRWRSHFGE